VETTTALAIFFSPLLLPPRSTLFPYTTLFRSDLVPTARVAHIGLYREPQTFVEVEYFFKSPSDLHERLAIVVSPVLATANTAVAAVDRLKERGAREIRLVCLLAAPEGVERFRGLHPDVPLWTAGIDHGLDENAFIL